MPDWMHFLQGLVEPHYAWGHFPYFLLVVSSLMRNIVWLRGIAIVAGIARVIIRSSIVYDPVAVAWEAALVLVNIGQLLLIWWDNRRSHSTADEALLAETVLPGRSRRSIKRLLEQAEWRTIEPGTVLLTEGEAVSDLLFVTEGVARIEKGGQLVAICSKGDFVGEMSFVAGGGASATVVADKPMRIASFVGDRLKAALAGDAELRHALESSFNRNLIGKLAKSNSGPAVATA